MLGVIDIKTNGTAPAPQRIQPTGKERPKSHFNSFILYVLFLATLRLFGDRRLISYRE